MVDVGWFDIAIEEILKKYELSKIEEKSRSEEKREKELDERNQAEDIRRQALESIGKTERRKMADENTPCRQRRQVMRIWPSLCEQDMNMHEDEMLLNYMRHSKISGDSAQRHDATAYQSATVNYVASLSITTTATCCMLVFVI